jgi:hypothetical protein
MKALVPTIKPVLYIFHSEIRVAIKIMAMIFTTGIDTRETKASQVDFCEELAYIVNYDIIGEASNPSQWQVHVRMWTTRAVLKLANYAYKVPKFGML